MKHAKQEFLKRQANRRLIQLMRTSTRPKQSKLRFRH